MDRHALALLAAAALGAVPSPALAASPAASVTIAGGVSLGAYAAGLTYYAVEAGHANPGLQEMRVVTGASAGSVNGFMAILQGCGSTAPDPRQSLFWKAWIPLGLEVLARPGTGSVTAAFSRAAFDEPLALLGEAWKAGLRQGCDVVFGISVTRLHPRIVSLKGERLRLPRVEEHFVVRVQGRGAGTLPRLTNYADPRWEGEQALLPEGKDGEVAFDAVADALFASTAFPGAFPPQTVRHCIVRGGAGTSFGCPLDKAASELFVDGGVFDNTPVRLAARIAAAGLRIDEGGSRWLDRPDLDRRELPRPMTFSYISTDVRTFPAPSDQVGEKAMGSMLAVAARVGGAFYDSARAKNLLYLQEEDPAFFERMVIPERHLPAASSPLGAFFGFLEGELRRFDFALGMYDARRMTVQRLAERRARAGGSAPLLLPEATPSAAAVPAGWRPYHCLSAVMDGGDAGQACQGDDLKDFRVVLQSSIERLWDRCASLKDLTGVYADDPLCRAASEGVPPRAVPGVGALADGAWRRQAGETETGFTVRLLAAHGLGFKDLGLTSAQSREAPARLRRRLLEVGRQVALTQPLAQAAVIETAVKLVADQVVYVPPRFTGWLVVGRDLEAGASYGFRTELGGIASVRLHAALQLSNTARVFSSEDGAVGFSPLLGIEVLPAAWSTTTLQPSLIFRGGFLHSSRDSFGFDACPTPSSDIIGSCSRPALGAGVAATALERIRLQLLFNYYPAIGNQKLDWWDFAPGLGLQFNF